MEKKTRRKFILGTLGFLGVGFTAAWINKNSLLKSLILTNNNKGLKISAVPQIGEDVCMMTTSQAEGPFFIASPIRKDIKEDRKGKAMNLRLQILRAPECQPIENAIVELWHCDAEGAYSGYPESLAHDVWATISLTPTGENVKPMNETRYLRGAQHTDAHGMVEFQTIFPGWYDPRTPHIHFKVLIDGKEQLTSQFYFEQTFQDKVHAHFEPYTRYGNSPYSIQNDGVLRDYKTIDGLVLKPIWHDTLPLEASAKIGVQLIG